MFDTIKNYYKNLVPALTDSEWMALQGILTVKQIRKGEYIIKEGQVCNHVLFINKGLVRLFYNANGKEISVGFFPENSYVSEYESFLTRCPATQNIDVLADSEIFELHYDHVQLLYKQYAVFQEFGRKMAEFLFIMLNQRNTALLVLSPEQRYRQMVVETNLYQLVPQYMLASFIGITPEHLSRIRKKTAERKASK
ncbi:MAG: Crp/Fnr family transcriptional regulator [Bacteroidota bacterium]|nr:Crp/Fnr family transcriptional regulator [Bacteroidota bacterium]